MTYTPMKVYNSSGDLYNYDHKCMQYFMHIRAHAHVCIWPYAYMVPHYLEGIDLRRIHIGSIYYYMYIALD